MNRVRLKELGALKNGLNYDKIEITNPCKIVGVKDFAGNISPDYKTLGYVEATSVSEDFYLEDGDIVFVRSNGNKNLVGRSMYIDNPPEGVCFSGFCIRFRPDKGLVDPAFLFYKLRSPYCKKQYSYSQQTNITNLGQEVLGNVVMDIPSIKRQKRIANVLRCIDEKILLNKKINENLQNQTQLIFAYMFPNIAYGKDHIGDIIVPQRGKPLLSKDAIYGDVPVVAGGLEPATYHNASNTAAPVLTISGSGANAGYVGLWHIPVWSSDSSYIDSSMTPYVYFWYSLLKKRQSEIFSVQSGSAQPHIYPKHIAELSLAPLNGSRVKEYNALVTPLFQTMGIKEAESKRLQAIRDWLLPMLMNGQATMDD